MNYSLQFMGNPAFPLRELPESTGGELGEDGLTFATKEKVSPYGLCNSSKWLPASRSHFCVCYRQATINGSPERNRFRKPGPLRLGRSRIGCITRIRFITMLWWEHEEDDGNDTG
jgi:hypothetical protein